MPNRPELTVEAATEVVHNITNKDLRVPVENDLAVILKYALEKWEDDNLTFFIEDKYPILTTIEVPETFSHSQITLLNEILDEIKSDKEDTANFLDQMSKVDWSSLME